MPVIKFIKEKKEITVPVGSNLRDEAVKVGINLNQGVNGIGAGVNQYINCTNVSKCFMDVIPFIRGSCGTCRVNIKKGMENTNPLSAKEYLRFKTPVLAIDPLPNLAYIGNEETMRLGCCTVVNGDIEVETGPEVNLFGENFFS